MTLRLAVPTLQDCLDVLPWRAMVRESLRTPYLLTENQQREFYQDIVCNRSAPHRYWGLYEEEGDDETFVGLGGLTNIEWENGRAEISLILDPAQRSRGLGGIAVRLLLAEAFKAMRLTTVVGECYESNQDAVAFWRRQVVQLGGEAVTLPKRKFWDGRHYDAYYFTFFAPAVRLIRSYGTELA